VPHGHLPDGLWADGVPVAIVINQNSLRDLRHEVAVRWDPHRVQNIFGRWVSVRKEGQSLFEEDNQRPLYASEEFDPEIGGVAAVFCTNTHAWWCEIEARKDTPGHWVYERWRTLAVWLARAAPILEATLETLPKGPLLWRTRFAGPLGDIEGSAQAKTFEDALAEIASEVDENNRIVRLLVGSGFEDALFHPDNIAERAIVHRLVEGVAQLSGQSTSDRTRESLMSQIVPDSKARNSHRFLAREFRHFVRSSIPESPIEIDRDDDAALRLGLGWSIRSRDKGSEIVVKADCTRFLNDIVRLTEDELCEGLRAYDRKETIKLVLRNHESAVVDRDRWRHTAGAVLALHEEKEATRLTMAEHDFELNAVFQATRLLVEIAICECPLEGRKLGRLDLSRMMAKVAIIAHVGGWSDAIRWDAMEPRLKITPLGDIHIDSGFIDNVLIPFGRSGSDAQFESAIEDYSKMFKRPDTQQSAESILGKEFSVAWNDEFGASLDQMGRFIDSLEDLGIKAKKAVLEAPRSHILDGAVGQDLPANVATAIMDAWSFKSRPAWREIPAGYEERDRQPWRFRRRLTVLRKPLIQVNDDDDPLIIVAPGIVRDAFAYMVQCYHRGDFPVWQLQSRTMRSWAGRSADRRGKEFNNEVAKRLHELGWNTEVEVTMTKVLKTHLDRDYGDIDVLAWNTNRRRVLVVECKDVHYRKTHGEIAEQLADFRGEIGPDGRPDLLRRHLDRVELASNHMDRVAAYLQMASPAKIEGHLVFKNPVPMQFAWQRMKERTSLHIFDNLKDLKV
jgi:hypothetical protein